MSKSGIWEVTSVDMIDDETQLRLNDLGTRLLAALTTVDACDDDDDDDDQAPDDDDDDDDDTSSAPLRTRMICQAAAWITRSPEVSIVTTSSGLWSSTRENPGRLWGELRQLGDHALELGLSDQDLTDTLLLCLLAWHSQAETEAVVQEFAEAWSRVGRSALVTMLRQAVSFEEMCRVLEGYTDDAFGTVPFGAAAPVLGELLGRISQGDDDDDDDDVSPDDDDDDDDDAAETGAERPLGVSPLDAIIPRRRHNLAKLAARVLKSSKQTYLTSVAKWFLDNPRVAIGSKSLWTPTLDRPALLWEQLAQEADDSDFKLKDLKDLMLLCSIAWRTLSGAERRMHEFNDRWSAESRAKMLQNLGSKREFAKICRYLQSYEHRKLGVPPFGAAVAVCAIALDEILYE